MALMDTFYNVFMRRTTVYLPFLFVGAYFTNEIIDYGVTSFWTARNRGKSFQEMLAAREAA